MTSLAPDADQQAIIGLDGGHHLVLAPPGCGKTFILTERVVRAHNHGTDYRDMVCLTFTNRASRGMRDRISQRTGNPVPPDLFVGNVHRFCSNYLFDQKKIPQNSAVIDDLDAESIIATLAHLDPDDNNSRFVADIVNLSHALSQRDAGFPAQLIVHADLLHAEDNPLNRRRIELARLYSQYKETDNLLDFEDLLERAYLFARAEGDSLHRYRWIQVDEVQDLNFLQFAIIDLFATPDATVVYLGDEQPAIFSFVGANVEALQQLKQRCAPNIHHLGTNHRSPAYLLDLFNTYAARQMGIDPQFLPVPDNADDADDCRPEQRAIFQACHHDLASYAYKEGLRCPHDGTSCTLCQRSCADEYRLAVSLARRYATIDPEGRVAIIVPTNADADCISREFGDTPHFKISGLDVFSSPTLQFLLSHLSVVANETCFIAWARILYHLRILPHYAAARNLMRQLRAAAVSPTDLLYYDGTTYLQQFLLTVDTQEIVLFDTETTGLDPLSDDIIQIAAVKVRAGEVVPGSEFNIIIETERELPPVVGGHDNPMLSVYLESDRLARPEGLRRFLDYCGDCVLMGHNVEFDWHILFHNVRRTLGVDLPQRIRFDTLKLTRLVEPRLRVYKLERLLETLQLEGINSHNALDDVLATHSLLVYCREKARQYLPEQQRLLADPHLKTVAQRFRDLYLPLYQAIPPEQYAGRPAIVQTLMYTYDTLVRNSLLQPVDKWAHIVNHITCNVIDPAIPAVGSHHEQLRQQLDLYLSEINTLREPDLALPDNHNAPDNAWRFFIATAHKAKGLEFDNVIVFNAVEGAYPYGINLKNQDRRGINEDMRRFYVAISRARKCLCFTYSGHGAHGRPSVPSPFLQSIAPLLTHYAFDPSTGHIANQQYPHNKDN